MPALRLLEPLRDDPSAYVRRSVANHLNDVSKDNPTHALSVLRRWLDAPGPHTEPLARHALRTLIKKGDARALGLLGYRADAPVDVASLRCAPSAIRLGEAVAITFTLRSRSRRPEPLVVDMAVHLVRSAGKTTRKVFKIKNMTLNAGDRVEVSKVRDFKPVTTRRYYSGSHRVDVLVNGTVKASAAFELTCP